MSNGNSGITSGAKQGIVKSGSGSGNLTNVFVKGSGDGAGTLSEGDGFVAGTAGAVKAGTITGDSSGPVLAGNSSFLIVSAAVLVCLMVFVIFKTFFLGHRKWLYVHMTVSAVIVSCLCFLLAYGKL